MTPEQRDEIRALIEKTRQAADRANSLADRLEAALAALLPEGDREKQREAERVQAAKERPR